MTADAVTMEVTVATAQDDSRGAAAWVRQQRLGPGTRNGNWDRPGWPRPATQGIPATAATTS